MFDVVRKSIADEKVLEILKDIIYSSGGGKNLPIGNLCSQWMGNLYLHEMDMFVKQNLRVRDYVRYADDFSLFHDDKKQLALWRDKLEKYLSDELKLTFSKSNISRVADGVDFVGYRHFPKFILLRRRTAQNIQRRIKKIWAGSDFSSDKVRGRIAAYNGWFMFACSYNMQKNVRFNNLKSILNMA